MRLMLILQYVLVLESQIIDLTNAFAQVDITRGKTSSLNFKILGNPSPPNCRPPKKKRGGKE